MKREKFVYNEKTLQYEKIESNLKQVLTRFATQASIVLVCAFGIYSVSSTYLPSPKEKIMEKELDQMENHFSSITNEFDALSSDLESLRMKDQEVNRLIFGLDAIDDNLWEGGIGGSDRYKYITKYSSNTELITNTKERVRKLKQQMDLQRKSLDTIYTLALEREEKLVSIPSIKPVQEDKLARDIRYLSGYGIRIHPVHKVKKFHKGIDFTAPEGTPIQATGNGKVVKVEKLSKGYGHSVTIDHGFGYKTLYAHMQEIHVKKGDKVLKGEQIGTVGDTGMSTAPHLHYEVKINGKNVNPIDYCLDGLTSEEYHNLVIKASIENQAFDY